MITVYLLFVMELASRRVALGQTGAANPDEPWMLQVARNASDAEDGFLREKKYLLMDRDTKFSEAFRVILEESGVTAVRLPPHSPNLSPNLERFMRSIKEECLERISTSERNHCRMLWLISLLIIIKRETIKDSITS